MGYWWEMFLATWLKWLLLQVRLAINGSDRCTFWTYLYGRISIWPGISAQVFRSNSASLSNSFSFQVPFCPQARRSTRFLLGNVVRGMEYLLLIDTHCFSQNQTCECYDVYASTVEAVSRIGHFCINISLKMAAENMLDKSGERIVRVSNHTCRYCSVTDP